ncbi:enoyl-CoA hydratase/isomerase family protein [Rummeliibacillus sp. JY-2-4R]
MNYQSIKVTTAQDGVCTVTLNRPEVRNAMGLQLREELKEFFLKVKDKDEVKAIILTGEGNVFSAGGDLSALKHVDAIAGRKRLQAGHELIQAILNLEKPVIAAVNGAAAGAGVSLALACDLIIASRSTVFIQSFAKVGLIPDLGSIYFLPKLVGRHRALELMFLGERVTAEQAQSIGMINRVVDDENLLDEASKIAQTISAGPANALGLMKKLVNRSVCDQLDESLEMEALAQSLCFESVEFKEGVQAFFEKRKPIFNP